MKTKKKNAHYYYLRDWWNPGWCRRDGAYTSKAEALVAARRLLTKVGNGARVQVVRVTTEVVAEVKS